MIMQEIFTLQWQLNVHTLRNIGLDYEKTIKDPEEKLIWIENYRKALSAELAELTREVHQFGMETQNGKVEIVDMLHFLVSLSHIVVLDPSEIPPFDTHASGKSFESSAIRTFLALDDLQNSLKWKWWARGGGFKPDKAKEAVMNLWRCFTEFCSLFGLDFHTMKRIYIAKNEVNFKRQEQNYNEDSKTEDDNRMIEI